MSVEMMLVSQAYHLTDTNLSSPDNFTSTELANFTFVNCEFESVSTFWFVILASAMCLLSGSSIILESLFLTSIISASSLLVNVRLVFANGAVACLLLSIIYASQAVYSLIGQIQGFPDVSTFTCSMVQGPVIMCASAVRGSVVIMIVERFIASHRAYVSKDQTQISSFIICIIALTWLWSFINAVLQVYFTLINFPPSSVCFCDSTILAFQIAPFVRYNQAFVTIEILFVLTYWLFWLYHRKKLRFSGINAARHNLNERVKILESIFVTNTILPVMTLHAVCLLSSMICMTLSFTLTDDKVRRKEINLIQSSHLFFAFYCCFNPVISFHMNSALRKSATMSLIIRRLVCLFAKVRNRREKKYVENMIVRYSTETQAPNADDESKQDVGFDRLDYNEENHTHRSIELNSPLPTQLTPPKPSAPSAGTFIVVQPSASQISKY